MKKIERVQYYNIILSNIDDGESMFDIVYTSVGLKYIVVVFPAEYADQ